MTRQVVLKVKKDESTENQPEKQANVKKNDDKMWKIQRGELVKSEQWVYVAVQKAEEKEITFSPPAEGN